MLAGAYSKTYQILEQQQVEHLRLLAENERGDVISKAKKLSNETNKRRKAQATKRKVEQEKEEKRRQLILSKRREQQREATEKYQRSHLPARPPSGRSSSSSHRAHSRSGRGLDETLRLIRGHSAHSGHHRHRNGGQGQSPRQTYNDALNKPYFNKYSSHRPNSPPEKCDSQAKNRLHNNSLRNLTNSKSLFEQQLEQQQRMLADQQKQAIHDFNNAVMQEMSEDNHGYGYNNYDNHDQCDSDSLSSVDSLERSQNQDSHYGNGYTHGNTGEIQPMEHMVSNSNVIRTSSSGVLTRDTHQNVRDVSAQLNSNFANMYSPMNPSDMTSQIDSYNVDQTQNISQKNMSRAEMKPDFQSAYQGVNKGNDNRPKVQLRAWATPSPVDGAHSSKAPVIPMTNTNPYTPRNTMTTVTMTTTYDENKSKNLQNNDRLEERPNPLNVYSNRLASHVIPNGYNVIDSNVGDNVQEREVQRNGTRNLEFLETVTNTLDKKVQSQGIVNVTMPVSQGTVPVSQGAMPVSQGALPVSQGALPFSQGTVPVSQGAIPVTQGALNNIDNRDNNSLSKPLPSTTNMSVPNSQGVASKLPRPVSAKNNSNIMHNSEAIIPSTNGNGAMSSKSHTSSFASTVPIPPGSPRTINTYNTPQKTMGVVRSNNTNNGTSNGPDENQKVFVNLGNDKPQVRQVTNVKFAASVVNGNVHMNNYGKMQVLPDRPVIIPQQTEKVYEGKPISGKKASDDSEVVTQKSELHGVNAAEVKGILKRPGGMRTLKKAGSTGTVHPAGFDVKDSIEIAKANIQTHHEPKQVPKKKSVRFADLRYSDDMEEEEPESTHTNRAAQKHHRPVSAKVSSQTKIETRIPRVSSAGSQRAPTQPKPHKSSLVRPQAAAHIIAHTSAATAILSNSYSDSNDKKVTFTNNDFMSKVPMTGPLKTSSITPTVTEVTVYSVPGMRMNYTSNMSKVGRQDDTMTTNGDSGYPMSSAGAPTYHNVSSDNNYVNHVGPVYNENGMRIDRTPTDDEINFLWEKVRTCLNRNSTAGPPVSEPPKSNTVTVTDAGTRQAAPVSNKYIDGAALSQMGPKSRVTVINQQNLTQAIRNNQQIDYRPTQNGETMGPYQKRFGLLQQRKQQQNPNSLTNKNGLQRQTITYHGPVYSNQEPSPKTNTAFQTPPEATESMAAFLTAEHLAQQSMSDSQIQAAMDDAQRQQQIVQAGRPPQQKVPSALSIEEQRLLESLDRLNEKLKITEFPGALLQEANQMPPEPVPQTFIYSGAFKGHQPINSQRRVLEASRGGGFRATSANRNQNFRYS